MVCNPTLFEVELKFVPVCPRSESESFENEPKIFARKTSGKITPTSSESENVWYRSKSEVL